MTIQDLFTSFVTNDTWRGMTIRWSIEGIILLAALYAFLIGLVLTIRVVVRPDEEIQMDGDYQVVVTKSRILNQIWGAFGFYALAVVLLFVLFIFVR